MSGLLTTLCQRAVRCGAGIVVWLEKDGVTGADFSADWFAGVSPACLLLC